MKPAGGAGTPVSPSAGGPDPAPAPAARPPLILAIDTTHEFGSLALVSGGETLEEVLLHAPEGFGHVIYTHLEQLLARHEVRMADIDCFACASGPGSFTGVRVGLACTKGLAEAMGKPAVAVGNLEALATFGTAPLRAVVMDARRGEVYGAVYDEAGRMMAPEVVAKFPAWLETLPAGAQLISAGSPPFLSNLADSSAGRVFENRVITAPRALAAAIARIARGRLLRGEACDPAALDANYVRRADAELFWRE